MMLIFAESPINMINTGRAYPATGPNHRCTERARLDFGKRRDFLSSGHILSMIQANCDPTNRTEGKK